MDRVKESSEFVKTGGFHELGLIVAAAGASNRFGNGRNKLLETLDGKPVICHCLHNFLPLLNPANIIVLVPDGMQKTFRQIFDANAVPREVTIAAGGKIRQQSVYNGIRQLPDSVEIVAIQDGARPYSTAKILAACVKSARQHGSGIAARPVTDTIKIAAPDGKVISTPDRRQLWAAETPQVFQRRLIEHAYKKLIAEGHEVTDDAQAAELAGANVYLVTSTTRNSKITFAEDLAEHNRE
jgi:2-C-methyl-D-erythritol 4-phosphate cytidylyltransferase